jgi:hypothetical protein
MNAWECNFFFVNLISKVCILVLKFLFTKPYIKEVWGFSFGDKERKKIDL